MRKCANICCSRSKFCEICHLNLPVHETSDKHRALSFTNICILRNYFKTADGHMAVSYVI